MLFRGRIIFGDKPSVADGLVAIAGDRIVYAGPTAGYDFSTSDAKEVATIIPGLVDVHHHGGAGGAYEDGTQKAREAAEHHHSMGSTTLVGSLVSATNERMLENIEALKPLVSEGVLAGIHLEGPFISVEKKGAHDVTAIAPGNPEWFRGWCEAGDGAIRSITLAAETENFDELIAICREYEVIPSVGHTDADAETIHHALSADERAGRTRGPWTTTHLFNAMNPILHRQPGPIPHLLDMARKGLTTVELIADDVHVKEDIVKMVSDAAGDGLIFITDSMAAAGLSDGDYGLGTLKVLVKDGVARIKNDDGTVGSIAGGVSRLFENVRRCIVDYGMDEQAIVRCASSRPAELYGFSDRGRLATNMRADLNILDDNFNLVKTVRAGREL